VWRWAFVKPFQSEKQQLVESEEEKQQLVESEEQIIE